MRPFSFVSLPEVPSYSDFASRVSLHPPGRAAGDSSHQTASETNESKDKASSILEIADQALKTARKDWEAISKAKAETAQCVGCEDWWRTSIKNVVRACITANIMVATSKKAMSNSKSTEVQDMLKVELVKRHELYHAWWMVPRISAK